MRDDVCSAYLRVCGFTFLLLAHAPTNAEMAVFNGTQYDTLAEAEAAMRSWNNGFFSLLTVVESEREAVDSSGRRFVDITYVAKDPVVAPTLSQWVTDGRLEYPDPSSACAALGDGVTYIESSLNLYRAGPRGGCVHILPGSPYGRGAVGRYYTCPSRYSPDIPDNTQNVNIQRIWWTKYWWGPDNSVCVHYHSSSIYYFVLGYGT